VPLRRSPFGKGIPFGKNCRPARDVGVLPQSAAAKRIEGSLLGLSLKGKSLTLRQELHQSCPAGMASPKTGARKGLGVLPYSVEKQRSEGFHQWITIAGRIPRSPRSRKWPFLVLKGLTRYTPGIARGTLTFPP